uniref:Integrase catalytic domain-containing protein n=1 Tax=Amphimedon queenslandica TaxID=400682 RepID=A0A1X7VI94_AMPQE
MVVKCTGKILQILRTDNGGECTSHTFETYLKSEGVEHELTIPNMPEQNGVAEHLNMTLMESVRSMLIGGQLLKRFWVEASSTGVYSRKRSPINVIQEVTPYEALLGVKPKVNHFRIFSCVAYAHICKEERRKVTDCTIDERKVFFSRDVIFDESKTDAVEKEVEQEKTIDNAEDNERESPVLRQSTRERRPPDYYGEYVNVTMEDLPPEPTTVEEALASPEHKKWKKTMNKEIESLKANKGFSQKAEVDYDETFRPVI